MKQSNQSPIYTQIAFDLAAQIAAGELREGERISGRSLMGSRYAVSPETTRRAKGHLSDLGILSIQPKVGSVVLSRKRAVEYVQEHQTSRDLHALKAKLREKVAQRDALNREIDQLFTEIGDLWERFRSSDRSRTYEFTIQPDSPAAGETIGGLAFRQKTGATVVAVRKGEDVFLSPGPSVRLDVGDVLVVACEMSHLAQVSELLEESGT